MQLQKSSQPNFHAGQNIDVLDSVKKWVNAEILSVGQTQISVHYTGWSAKYDENIPKTSPKILQQWEPGKQLRVNNRVDGYHPLGGWLQARVIDIDPQNSNRVKLHFFNYHAKYDLWADIQDRNQVSIIGSKSKAFGMGKKRTKNRKQHFSEAVLKALRQKLQKFMQSLKGKKWIMKNIEGDGNCLFRSISHQLYGDDRFHEQIRQLCMRYIELQRNFFEDYIVEEFEDYVEKKKKNGEWGDDVEIQAISEIYGRPIQIYAFGERPIRTFHQDNSENTEPIRLAYVGLCHYNSITPEEKANQQDKGLMNYNFGEYEQHFLETFEENRQKIIQHRSQFANCNTIEEFIGQHFEAENRGDEKNNEVHEQDFEQVLKMTEKEDILDRIEQAEMEQAKCKAEQQKLEEQLKRIEQKELEQARKLSSNLSNNADQFQRPYWFDDLVCQGFSENQIKYAIEINGYDPDKVQNFLLDNLLI